MSAAQLDAVEARRRGKSHELILSTRSDGGKIPEPRIRWGRQDEVHTAHTGNRSGEARAAAAGTRGHAVGDRLLPRTGNEVPAGQVDKRPLRSRQAQATSADTGAEWGRPERLAQGL